MALEELYEEKKPIKGGQLSSFVEHRKTLKGKRFIFTVAQNNTKLHEPFWNTLVRMSKKLKAKLCVGKITYNKSGWQQVTAESEGVWFDPKVTKYFIDEQVKVAEGLLFCGELDILPTAVLPFTGLHNYSGPHSAIIPHTKMQMQSLATMKGEPAKFLYTTGAVTMRNYIQRRAGQIAEYHHVYGALYVEVSDDGHWFVRQLNADDNGVVFDLDQAHGPTWSRSADIFGRPTVTLGDIHLEKSDVKALSTALTFARSLNPSHLFIHDLIDFRARNHHNVLDAHFWHEMQTKGSDSVQEDIRRTAVFLRGLKRRFENTEIVVVKSNHDEAFERWVKSPMKNIDPVNMRFWHECNAQVLRHVEMRKPFDVFAWALYMAAPDLIGESIRFLQADESFMLNGIEYGMHGHLGPNGSRGNPKNFRQIGRRVNHGHTHSAGIIDGIYTAGVTGSLDMGYNRGPNSWSHSHIVTYSNGKRTIVTQRGTKWRA